MKSQTQTQFPTHLMFKNEIEKKNQFKKSTKKNNQKNDDQIRQEKKLKEGEIVKTKSKKFSQIKKTIKKWGSNLKG